MSARVCLLITAAHAAASGGRRSTVLDLLQEAEETAGRIPIAESGKPAGLFLGDTGSTARATAHS
ncbi:hypothetical protein [Streptomyces sp. NPDC002746]